MAGYWLKLYTEILDDPKYFRLSDNAKLGMIELMVVAKRVDMEGEIPCIEDVAFYTRRSVEWWQPVFDELQKIEYLIFRDSELIIRKFAERQAKVDDAERMKKSREKKHRYEFSKTSYDDVTNRNGDTDTDTDTEKIKKQNHFFVGEFLRISEIPGIRSDYHGIKLCELRDKYTEAKVLKFADWCKNRQIVTIEDALKAAETALPKWKDSIQTDAPAQIKANNNDEVARRAMEEALKEEGINVQ